MEIAFRLSRKEYEEYIKAVTARIYRKAKIQRKSLFYSAIYWSLMAFIAFKLLSYFQNSSSNNSQSDLAFLVAFILAIIVFIFQKVHQQRAILYFSVDELGPVLDDQKLSFADSGIHYVARDHDSHISWAAISHFEETKNLFLLYTDMSKALFVPKRAFSTREHEASFVDFVKSKQPSRGL